jgi:3',5'-cyclic AMP phosphodiesterase CpdA
MTDTTIAHLSDLHLANDFFWRSLKDRRWYVRKDDERLIAGLSTALGKLKPDYVVISGDIVNASTAKNFSRAAAQVQGMLASAGVDLRNVLVVPGNHDAPVFPKNHEVFERLKEFSVFLKQLFRQDDFSSCKPRFTRLDSQRRLCIIGLDSTLKAGKKGSPHGWLSQVQLAEGEVGTSQREWFRSKIANLETSHADFDNFVRVVVLHHHFDIENTAPSERFMQLLDRADVEKMLGDCGVNVVLHGHKHHPHVKRVEVSATRHYTVVGAGATLCTIPGETANHGNTFNVIKLRPSVNKVEIERYKATSERQFVKDGDTAVEQLFHAGSAGYTIGTMELTTRIDDMTGKCVDMNRRMGLIVDGRDMSLRQMSFRWGLGGALAAITGFEFDRDVVAKVEYERDTGESNPQSRKGAFVFREEQKWGNQPLDFWWTFRAERAFCMRQSDWATYYPGRPIEPEGVEAKVTHQAKLLVLKVQFPDGFRPKIRTACFDQNNEPRALVEPQLQEDRLSGTTVLLVRKPVLGYRYELAWDVPK